MEKSGRWETKKHGDTRLQIFELEDLPWFPLTIRDLATDYLQFMEKRLALHEPVVPLLRYALEESNATRVVDLCSRGGGPVLCVYEALIGCGITVRFTLTDKYPNLPAFRCLAARHPSGILTSGTPLMQPQFREISKDCGPCSTRSITSLRSRRVAYSSARSKRGSRSGSSKFRNAAWLPYSRFSSHFRSAATPFIRPSGGGSCGHT